MIDNQSLYFPNQSKFMKSKTNTLFLTCRLSGGVSGMYENHDQGSFMQY